MNNTEKIKKQLKLRDRVVRVLAKDKNIRAIALKNTNSAKLAQKKHNLDFLKATYLAKHLSAATIMASFLKGEERIIIESEGNGPIKRVFAEALHVGEVRGYIDQRSEITVDKEDDIDDYLGIGVLKVSRVLYNKSQPVQGIVPLQKGDIATDLAYYYTQSEQVPSSVVLDVKLDKDGNITQSGGIMIQAMPDATEEDLKAVYDKILEIGRFSDLLSDELMPEDILNKILPFEYDVMDNKQVDFYCRCSKEKFMDNLMTFPNATIKDMEDKNENELVCRYCNEKYYLEKEDFEKLKEVTIAKSN